MAARKKNPECKTQAFSAALPKYQVDAIRLINASQSSVIRDAIDHYLNLTRPPEYIDMPKPKAKPKTKK